MNIHQKERIFFFNHATTILSFFKYSIRDEKVIKHAHNANQNLNFPNFMNEAIRILYCLQSFLYKKAKT